MVALVSLLSVVLLLGCAATMISSTLVLPLRDAAAAALSRRAFGSEAVGTSKEHAKQNAPEIVPIGEGASKDEHRPHTLEPSAGKIEHMTHNAPGAASLLKDRVEKNHLQNTLSNSIEKPKSADHVATAKVNDQAKYLTEPHHGLPRGLAGKIPAIGMRLSCQNVDAALKTIREYWDTYREKALTLGEMCQRERHQEQLTVKLRKQAQRVARDRTQLLHTGAGRDTEAMYAMQLQQQQVVRALNDIQKDRVKRFCDSEPRHTHLNRVEHSEQVMRGRSTHTVCWKHEMPCSQSWISLREPRRSPSSHGLPVYTYHSVPSHPSPFRALVATPFSSRTPSSHASE